MHEKDILEVLESLRRRCEEEGIPIALLGALAMQYYDFVRHTEDIDILTTKEGLDKIHEVFVGRGIVPRATGLRKKLRETEHYVSIDVITTGEHAGSNSSPIVYPHPESDDFVVINKLRIPKLHKLIEFKLTSGVWGNRLHDLGDVVRLITANRLDEKFAEKLHPELRAKYLDLLNQARSEKDIE